MRPPRFLRPLVVATCLIFAAVTVISTVSNRRWVGPEPVAAAPDSAASQRTIAVLRRGGIGLSKDDRDAIKALVFFWRGRADLIQAFPAIHGGAPLASLLGWVLATNDYGALIVSRWRPAFVNVSRRIGLRDQPVPGGADVDITVYLLALADERARPQFSVRPAQWELIRVWRERPDVRARFAHGPIVEVRKFLRWSYTIAPDDPAFAQLKPVFGSLARWDLDLPPTPWG